MKNDLSKIVLLSAAITVGCTPWRISADFPFPGQPNYNLDCSHNLPPQIEMVEKSKTILFYDPDNMLESYGWDLDRKVAYATDVCGKSTIKIWKCD